MVMVSHSVVTSHNNYHSHDGDGEDYVPKKQRVYHCNGTSDWPAPTHSWECYVPNGKAGITQLHFIHFTDASLRVLLYLLDQHCRCCSSWSTHFGQTERQ